MAKGSRVKRRIASRRRPAPYSVPCWKSRMSENMGPRKCSKALDKKEWEDATCSVCMECPHNAVLLLCSSHDKGCRPYMCGTSFRYSNCLDQYKKAYTKVISSNRGTIENRIVIADSALPLVEKCETLELACPLCRGQVKGWTVVEPAREHLNAKKRNCMQDECSFVGTYKELRKHVRAAHPSAKPREVDPDVEEKWRSLEQERERNDVISTIRSTMPGAMVFGDYVIEGGNHYGLDERFDVENVSDRNGGGFEVGFDSNLMNVFLLLHAFGASGNEHGRRGRQNEGGEAGIRRNSPVGGLDYSDQDEDDHDHGHDHDHDGDDDGGISFVSRLRRHGRALLNRSGRRRRRRELNQLRGR